MWQRARRIGTICYDEHGNNKGANKPVQIQINIPEGAFSALRVDPEIFVKEMRLAAAIKWYETGRISQSKAAGIAEVSRHAFLDALRQYNVSPFQVTPEELAGELENA